MGHHRFACLLLLLLTALSHGFFFSQEKGPMLKKLGDKLKEVHERVGDTFKERVNFIFNPPGQSNSTNASTADVTTPLPQVDSRQIITAPIRCPPNHNIAAGKCRKIIR
ncbi:secapin-like [Megachile rotundata]|uniref:secapin-like n=1 Tax=Megachile rotundata TaxID=143995 RepID=UPI003FD4BEB2